MIYVCCHKDYTHDNKTDSFKAISSYDINVKNIDFIKISNILDQRNWCELSAIYYIWKNIKTDVVGLVQYRRQFVDYDGVNFVAKPVTSIFSNYTNYDIAHNSEDLRICFSIVQQLLPEYQNAMLSMFDCHQFIPHNMFVLEWPVFDRLCRFLFSILFTFVNTLQINSNEAILRRINAKPERYLHKVNYGDVLLDSPIFQSRLFALLSERLTTAFYIHERITNFKEVKLIKRLILFSCFY